MNKTVAKNQKDKKGKPDVKNKQMVANPYGSKDIKPFPAMKLGTTNAAKVAKAAGVPKKTLAMKPPEAQAPMSLTAKIKQKAQEARFGPDGDIKNAMEKGITPADFMGGMFQKREPPKNAQEKRQQKKISPFWACGYSRGEFMLLMWSVWIIVGTAYYASPGGMNLGFCKGFFKAVDVGYSIGWGYPAEETNGQMIFSVIYCIIGASFVAMALGFFADSVIEDSQSWFDNLQEKAEYEAVMQQGTLYYKAKEYVKFHWLKVRIVLLWFIWLLFGIIFVAATHQDNFAEGLIFSVTSMSTGGLRGLPTDAPDWEWFVVGAFAATGVPLMGLAMGTIAQALMDHDSLEDVEGVLNMPVDAEELENMQNFGFDDDGLISNYIDTTSITI